MKLFHRRAILFILLLTSFFTPSIARDTITPTQPLADNETLISSGGQFALGFFTPANSERRYIGMWFNKIGDQKIVWVANRASPVINSTGLLSVTANGTVMITDTKKSTIVWAIGTTGGSNVSIAQLLDDGNLVLKQDDDNNSERYAWQSFDYPTDTLLPGMKLGLDRITGLSRNLTSWKTQTDPSEGEYCDLVTDINAYLYSRSGKVWRSGQLDGIELRNNGLVYSKLNNSQEMTLSFKASDKPTIFVASRLGKVQLLTWLSDSRQWDTLWEQPRDQCDTYGHCGANGICDITTTPICKCLHGFLPKNPYKWASADWTNGCVRKTELDCRNGTDGFVQISGAKLPESPITFTDSEFSLDDCRLMCLRNCSCTAYAMYPAELGCMIWMTDWLLDIMQEDGLQQDLYIRTAYADLEAWKAKTDPSEGEYYLVNTDIDRYLYSRSGKFWRSAQWDGIDLRSNGLVYSTLNNSQEVSISFQASDKPTIFVASRLGKVQLLTWLSDSRQWDTPWKQPRDQCDTYGQCGANGICDITTTPICKCIHGFVPKNPNKWASANWTNGCIRKTELDCRNNTDGFVPISGVKIPDSPISFLGSDLSLEECRLKCFNNCSCTAYAMYPGEDGCKIWTDWLFDVSRKDGFQQDLYIRTAYADLVSSTQSQKNKVKMVVILAPLLSGLVLLITCVTYFIHKTKGGRKSGTNFSNGNSNESNEDLNIPLFEFGTIEIATSYFRDENTLGQGGFGTVYKGKLANNEEIAVKRLGRTSLQGIDEFKNEVMVIAKLQNRNLVRLLGYCIQAEERILIYEYMPNKSLDFFLFGKEKGSILDWRTRYQIIIGITRGLLYLHHDSRFRIIHRDLKASNILLDKAMNPKISDFGMARLFGGDDTDFKTKKVVGTYGYMSPEYAMGGIFSLKSDVYSYGVLILEIISGKKNSGAYPFPPYINLVAHVWNLWNEGKAFELVDESMSKSFSEVEVLRCIKVGLLCVQELPAYRPLMSSVMVMLGADSKSLPEPTQPGFIKTEFLKLNQNSNKQNSHMSNDLTITLVAR